MKPHLLTAQSYWKMLVHPGDCVIDATVGNGHDTLFLTQLLAGKGQLIGYDIQERALKNTEEKLQTLPLVLQGTVRLKLKSHAAFDESSAKLIVYNLGYLPGADKTLTTQCETTLKSVQAALEIISEGGAISIMCYPGHPEGALEQQALLDFLSALPSENWTICHHIWINRPLNPTLLWIKKLKSLVFFKS